MPYLTGCDVSFKNRRTGLNDEAMSRSVTVVVLVKLCVHVHLKMESREISQNSKKVTFKFFCLSSPSFVSAVNIPLLWLTNFVSLIEVEMHKLHSPTQQYRQLYKMHRLLQLTLLNVSMRCFRPCFVQTISPNG